VGRAASEPAHDHEGGQHTQPQHLPAAQDHLRDHLGSAAREQAELDQRKQDDGAEQVIVRAHDEARAPLGRAARGDSRL
jgi:hypothetical protein